MNLHSSQRGQILPQSIISVLLISLGLFSILGSAIIDSRGLDSEGALIERSYREDPELRTLLASVSAAVRNSNEAMIKRALEQAAKRARILNGSSDSICVTAYRSPQKAACTPSSIFVLNIESLNESAEHCEAPASCIDLVQENKLNCDGDDIGLCISAVKGAVQSVSYLRGYLF